MSTGISCVFLNTCDKLQFTIVDTYLTFACAVCTFNANQYNSQCHRYLINICQAGTLQSYFSVLICAKILISIADFRHSFHNKAQNY